MLTSVTDLAPMIGRVSLLDVRWDVVGGPDRAAYAAGHLPGAAFVDLDAELAAPAGAHGRHPLPRAFDFAAAMRRAGVSRNRPVVVYDARTSTAAARAWWLLRYFGHPDVSVLDGGLAAWVEAGLPLEEDVVQPDPGDFAASEGGMPVLDADTAAALARTGVLVDARTPERYLGEREPIDAVAGHIPGAVNRPTGANLDERGRFLPPTVLRQAFTQLGLQDGTNVGAYCGSGVTAAHEVLALHLAGYPAALYPGSWSEWITDPSRPVQTAD